MERQELIGYLLEQIADSDAVNGDFVLIRKSVALELVRILSGQQEVRKPVAQGTEGKILFFCADCGKSFWADPREDPECYARWKYHTWYADCPACGREVSQNDRYWR